MSVDHSSARSASGGVALATEACPQDDRVSVGGGRLDLLNEGRGRAQILRRCGTRDQATDRNSESRDREDSAGLVRVATSAIPEIVTGALLLTQDWGRDHHNRWYSVPAVAAPTTVAGNLRLALAAALLFGLFLVRDLRVRINWLRAVPPAHAGFYAARARPR